MAQYRKLCAAYARDLCVLEGHSPLLMIHVQASLSCSSSHCLMVGFVLSISIVGVRGVVSGRALA